MMSKSIIQLCITLAPVMAWGYGIADLEGAWALEGEPKVPCLVVTNNTVWVKEADCWRPSRSVSSLERGCSFHRLEAARDAREVFFAPAGWEFKRVLKAGVQIKEGEFVWLEERRENNRTVYENVRKVVRTDMPDWKAVLDESRYVGCWKPVKVRKNGTEKTGDELGDGVLLKIRPDRMVILRNKGKVEKGTDSPYRYFVEKWLPVEGGLRYDYRERYAKYDNPLNYKVKGMWMDPAGQLICYDYNEIMTMQRTDEVMDDPVDARRKMVADKSYHGVWGVNSEFNICVLGFEAGGRGTRSGFMIIMPFNWTVNADGTIHCVCDEEWSLMAGSPKPVTFDCRYDPVRNAMTMIDQQRKDEEAAKAVLLPYMGEERGIPELLKRLDDAKLDPSWKGRLGQMRERMKQK